MRDFVARLIDCGMTRDTALVICRYYRRRGLMSELAQYVCDVERETNGRVDYV